MMHTKEIQARLVLVDDHPIFRRGLAFLLGEQTGLEICGEAGDASEAMAVVTKLKPDLVVIDLSLAGGSGLELVKQVRAVNSEIKILVCTMHDEKLYAERTMRAGADGFINKEEASENILEAVRHILRGKIYLSEEMTERMVQRRLRGGNDAGDREPEERLTDRELDVFGLIGQGLSGRKIAEKLSLSPKTIDTHREHIKTKLGAQDNAELVQRAVEWHLARRQ